jgi:hypothetical protein
MFAAAALLPKQASFLMAQAPSSSPIRPGIASYTLVRRPSCLSRVRCIIVVVSSLIAGLLYLPPRCDSFAESPLFEQLKQTDKLRFPVSVF